MVTQFAAGQRVTAARLNFLLPIIVIKTADESLSTSTTLQNDNDLAAAMVANATYRMQGMIFYSSGATPDIKVAFTFPSGVTAYWGGAGYDVTAGSNTVRFVSQRAAASGSSLLFEGSTADAHLLLNGLFIVGSTAGNLQFQWAQNSSSGTTTVQAGSWMSLTRVE